VRDGRPEDEAPRGGDPQADDPRGEEREPTDPGEEPRENADRPDAPSVPVGELVELTPPAQVAKAALNRARAAARAKGIRPGQQPRRMLVDPPRSGAGPSGRDPQKVSDVLARLLHEREWVSDVSVGGVIGRWREVVGDQLADHCVPETFEDRVLVVRADSTAWATQVQILVPRLLDRLAQEIGDGVVETVTVLGPAGPSFLKGLRSVRGRGPRDTFG
jgi:predicted nucleic acid-binding Zn ribbon protein